MSRASRSSRSTRATPSPTDDELVRPFVHRTRDSRALHFSIHEVQSFMRSDAPDALALAYTRLMMGFLLWHPQPARIGLIGLGGGSLVKFCHRHLSASHLEVVEINPHVLELRDEFEIPADDARLTILQADGARWVRERPEAFDVLMVDGYDYDGLPSALATQRFYDDCAAALRPQGLLVLNLFRGHPHHAVHLDRLRRSFDDAVLEVPDGEAGALDEAAGGANSAVFAGRGGALTAAPLTDPPPGMADEAWVSLAADLDVVRRLHAQPGPHRDGSTRPLRTRRSR
ncbi:MAG TPA: fused MFS/spermidine synthase [Burkholderiaceae bacterium]|nr:fused MFS/spermidine synthase [Burkholderiaceae bacterium]HNG82130.1 fused MFS/spermidine synthase [Burkholderiaceae bacterium]